MKALYSVMDVGSPALHLTCCSSPSLALVTVDVFSPGFSERVCFGKVLILSEAQLGAALVSWP